MIFFTAAILVFILTVYFFVRQPSFGKISSGQRLDRIKKSPHYRKGKFQNLNPTPELTEGVGYPRLLKEFFTDRSNRIKPKAPLPSVKTDLNNLSSEENVLVWFGHSSYFIQADGKRFLVDPVFSGAASPIKSTTRSYEGTDIYSYRDMPVIDYLFISHDHWDHLDYETILRLKPKIKSIVTGLGTAAHLERWGFDHNLIRECDWNEEVNLDSGIKVHTAPARHFSGRGFKRNQVLWMSFVLKTPSHKIYLGGDSGYDTHFAAIGKEHGPFNLAILECGQYNKNWKYIHMMPEELVQASYDLKAATLLPVHWGKFSLAQHAWDEPIIRVVAEARRMNQPVIHPMIGEKVDLRNPTNWKEWWVGID